jgi:hypothetical protein
MLGKLPARCMHSKVNELKLGENILNNPKDIAKGFNSYFSNIGPDLASQIHTSSCNFETYMSKKLNRNLQHSNLLMLIMFISC